MEYRQLPRGGEHEKLSALGVGLGGIQKATEDEIEQVIRRAIGAGVNFFDLCASARRVYAPFGRAVRDCRDRVFWQQHFGAVYNEKGEYAWSRDVEEVRRTIEWELEAMKTDTIDFGFLHCVDEDEDYDKLVSGGIWAYLLDLKRQGVVRHIGFSSHTPAVANRILDSGMADMMLFSINPAYDYECGDEYGVGTASERYRLFRRCQTEGVGISVMKPFHGGKLLQAETSPFRTALSHSRCIQYALDRPGVLSVTPGVRDLEDLEVLLKYLTASPEERDYSVIASFTPENVSGSCVYCNHCQPCPAGIDVGLVNKYYDLACTGDELARGHYRKLSVQADACLQCGHCDARCPFHVKQSTRMQEIDRYFGGKE